MGADREIDHLILYDGICKFCNRSINFILEHESQAELTFAPLQSQLGQSILKDFNLPLDYTESLLFLSKGEINSHAQAAFKIAGFLRAPWRWIRIFKLLPTFISNFFYSIIAKHRYRLMGQADACMLPPPEARDRFLE
ncbi:thiol-disulfide oxidoreductase DCC family protein [Reichenbachiella sp.]|uniref:thiol-disulfide oxidoreductase DCC family protein n=1 Tax=Reichenbachiella sp. TaxID=2184521 RepID=UPI003B5A78DB